ncbi:hypothetical protein JCM10908_006483 [Rhodotorula pacifica]|uniref:uncharacterized protein n=1 Tax=Rhodotorula pacifica TaxID=1495444 RepID=UPI00317DB3E2
MVASAEHEASHPERVSPRIHSRGAIPIPPADPNVHGNGFWTPPHRFCPASSPTRPCACYCPRSGYAFDWLANAVQHQATAVTRLEEKVDQLAVLLEAVLATSPGAAAATMAGDDAGQPLGAGDLPHTSNSAPEVLTSHEAQSDRPTSSFFSVPTSRAEALDDLHTTGSSEMDLSHLRTAGESLVRKLMKLASPNGLVVGSMASPSPTDEYDRLSTTSHDESGTATRVEDEQDSEDSGWDDGEEDVHQPDTSADIVAKHPAKSAETTRPAPPVGSWLDSIE